MKTVLVTGGTGYIGSFVVDHLIAEGFRVVAIGRNLPAGRPESESFSFLRAQSTESLIELLLPFSPEGLIQLAAFYTNDHRPADVREMLDANVVFLSSVTEAAVETGAKWLVNIGSHAQLYGSANSPANLYAASKSAFQEILRFYADARGLRVASLLLGDVYGPDDSRRKILNIWRDASESATVVGMSPGQQIVQPIHVLDVVSAITHTFSLLSQAKIESPSTYLVRGDRALTLFELAHIFSSETGRRLSISWGERPYHPREMMDLTTLTPGLPEWKPAISLEQGLRSAFVAPGFTDDASAVSSSSQ